MDYDDVCERKEILKNKEKIRSKKNISLVLTDNRIFQTYQKLYRQKIAHSAISAISFKRIKNMQDLISDNLIKDEIFRKKKLETRRGERNACGTTRSTLFRMQILYCQKFSREENFAKLNSREKNLFFVCEIKF